MTQGQINTIKRECFPDLVQLADELEEKGYFVGISRNILHISIAVFKEAVIGSVPMRFEFNVKPYDTIREANTAFQKQLKAFRKEVLGGE